MKTGVMRLVVSFFVMFVLVGLMLFGLGYYKVNQIMGFIKKSQSGAFAPPPTAVTTEVAQASGWRPYLETIGTVMAINGVTRSTDLAGTVVQLAFESGTKVHAGDLLVQLDIKQEQAQLKQAEAQCDLAGTNLKRNRELQQKHTIAQSDLDSSEADYRSGQANVEAIKATIAKKTIRAPFDGMVGIRQVNLGQYVSPGQPIVSIQAFDPTYVNFYIPQQNLGSVAIGHKVEVHVNAFPNDTFSGQVTAINPQIDENSRNAEVQATLSNPEGKLRPGMFVRVDITIGADRDVVAIPASSINYTPEGESVYLVSDLTGKDGKHFQGVKLQPVKVGQARGDMIVITSGLKPGDVVVSSGVFRLRDGAKIIINNSVKPESELAPRPADS
jgi:membrane fusion protein, multidrug efflux system